MRSHSFVFHQTLPIAIGQCIGSAFIMGAFFLAGHFDSTVLPGCIAGALIALGNYVLMTFFACLASDKAAQQDVPGGQKLLQLSYLGRMAGLAVVLAVFAKSGRFHMLTLMLPLLFTRPILTIHALFRRNGGNLSDGASC